MLSPEQQSEFHVAHALTSDTNDLGVLHPVLRLLSERLGSRLRRRNLTAGRLRLEATYADYTMANRTVPLKAAVLDGDLWEAARHAFGLANTKRLAFRCLALTLDQLVEKDAQLELWGGTAVGRYDGNEEYPSLGHYEAGEKIDESELYDTAPSLHSGQAVPPYRRTALQHAVDCIHSRYGAKALRQGSPLSHRSRPAHQDPAAPSLHSGQAVPPYRRTADSHQTTTTLPKVAFPSSTR